MRQPATESKSLFVPKYNRHPNSPVSESYLYGETASAPSFFKERPESRPGTFPKLYIWPEMLTPARAAELLKLNINNRTLQDNVVARYTKVMQQEEWALNGHTIIVTRDGVLINGQHRCHAIIECGEAQPMLIVWGVDDEIFSTIDNVKKRSNADHLKSEGAEYEIEMSALINFIQKWRRSKRVSTTGGAAVDNYVTPKMAIDYFRSDPVIQEAARFAGRNRKSIPGLSGGSIGFLWYLFHNISPADNAKFWDGLVVGAGLDRDSPILTMRKKLLWFKEKEAKKIHFSIETRAACMIKVWNRFRKGKSLKQVTWTPDEKYPQPI